MVDTSGVYTLLADKADFVPWPHSGPSLHMSKNSSRSVPVTPNTSDMSSSGWITIKSLDGSTGLFLFDRRDAERRASLSESNSLSEWKEDGVMRPDTLSRELLDIAAVVVARLWVFIRMGALRAGVWVDIPPF